MICSFSGGMCISTTRDAKTQRNQALREDPRSVRLFRQVSAQQRGGQDERRVFVAQLSELPDRLGNLLRTKVDPVPLASDEPDLVFEAVLDVSRCQAESDGYLIDDELLPPIVGEQCGGDLALEIGQREKLVPIVLTVRAAEIFRLDAEGI